MRASVLVCLVLVSVVLLAELQRGDAVKVKRGTVRDDESGDDTAALADTNENGSEANADTSSEGHTADNSNADGVSGAEDAGENHEEGAGTSTESSESSESSASQNATPEEEAEAMANFEVVCTTCGDDSDGEGANDVLDYDDFEDHGDPMFVNSSLTGLWKTCAESNNPTADDCYVESEYTDTISFKFYVGFSDVYELKNTSVTVEGGDAHPEVTSLFLDDDLDGIIQIRYYCSPSDRKSSKITFNFLVTKSHSVSFTWIKVCGGGKNDKVEMGYKTEDDEKRNVPFSESTDLVIPPMDSSTSIYIKLKKPAKLQTYEAPVVTSDNDLISATVRGFGAKGLELRHFNAEFTINYECRGEATGMINLSVGLPPFDPLVATWKKECGNSTIYGTSSSSSAVPLPLDIGTASGQFDVMHAGKPTDRFHLDFDSGMNDEGLFRFETTDHKAIFYLRNTAESGEPLNLHAATVTVRDREVLYADTEFGTTNIYPGKEMRLPVRLVCLRDGVSSALVTISTAAYGNIEFGFSKACQAPVKREESGFLTTSKSLFNAMLLLTLIVGAIVIHHMRKRGMSFLSSRRSYAQVSQRG
eukprot:Plantae.Rhodophyta-Purpureofilum_apyrenoidigerum.ctg8825.p1 GENE.Plantae.Rhodophyta-Purpureofilum_apyrenoidigerum.ctg8825~~Plantae.Rhodophyta-Purpureofilum_apyrenoidigerum.ctg8825.p1  ORF type:complete len:588 (+),score=135.74 Plantae.Rhodophyta-Purpureofilum_apyrenoidigerum.ctg8825:137-1900(+)